MRIGQVVGERVKAQREEREWSQAQLGERVGAHLGQPWTRQSISAAELGKRAFTAGELVAFANVLGVSVTYLLTPPLDAGPIEIAPGVAAEPEVIRDALAPFKGTDSYESKFTESSMLFFQHLADLKTAVDQVGGDIETMITELVAAQSRRAGGDSP